jgi:DNA-binding response OmpR family regulator
MRTFNILLLEDEWQLAKVVKDTLQKKGYSVTHVTNGKQGLESLQEAKFDLFIVDIMMPLQDGYCFVKELRKKDTHVPVLFLSAKSRTEDVIKGFEGGGNDYLKKPFSLEELLLRIKELFRRSSSEGQLEAIIYLGNYTFLHHKQELWYNDVLESKLSHRENELLILLAERKNMILYRSEALIKVWGDDNFFNKRTMDVFITKLRKHLQKDASIEILNIRGVGYKLIV